uniref:Uncharacterized protein n=1 Tax=Anguilla anguilla TaxID=7936 RepID=A0A0E9VJZ4_ANGAN
MGMGRGGEKFKNTYIYINTTANMRSGKKITQIFKKVFLCMRGQNATAFQLSLLTETITGLKPLCM